MARLLAFKHAMDQIYGPFATISDPEHWEPPLNSGGHRGRYLWTDAFGVLNFLTLHHESMRERPTSESTPYLKMAERLVSSVHDILGYTRDGSTRLPGATDTEPLKGGLRIGKNDAEGPDCDGQYHHYLSLWMFALNRLSLVTKNHYYNDQAVSLARAIHPRFFVKRENSEPRMVWKLSIDLTKVLVNSEGNLDAIEGYVIYRILQATARYQHVEEPKVRGLEEEINDYRRVMQRKGNHLVTSDALDLGMTMWTTHWFTGKEIWAKQLMQACQEKANLLYSQSKYFHRPLSLRIAYRELGACLGIQCALASKDSFDEQRADVLKTCTEHLVAYWNDKLEDPEITPKALKPMSMVMFPAAMIAGAFQAGYFGPEPSALQPSGQ